MKLDSRARAGNVLSPAPHGAGGLKYLLRGRLRLLPEVPPRTGRVG